MQASRRTQRNFVRYATAGGGSRRNTVPPWGRRKPLLNQNLRCGERPSYTSGWGTLGLVSQSFLWLRQLARVLDAVVHGYQGSAKAYALPAAWRAVKLVPRQGDSWATC